MPWKHRFSDFLYSGFVALSAGPYLLVSNSDTSLCPLDRFTCFGSRARRAFRTLLGIVFSLFLMFRDNVIVMINLLVFYYT